MRWQSFFSVPRIAFTCLFCDDIRDEVSGKVSYMGVYTDDLVISKMPTIIPKFSICVIAMVPIELINVDGLIIIDMLGEEQPFPLVIAEETKKDPPKGVAGLKVIMQVSRNCFGVREAGSINVYFEEGSNRRLIDALEVSLASE